MTKYEGLTLAMGDILWEISSISKEEFITIISKNSYNINKQLGDSKYSKLKVYLDKIFPGKKGQTRWHTHILLSKGMLYCIKCCKVKLMEHFPLNNSKSSGYNSACKECHYTANKTLQVARSAKYKASQLNQCPVWADLDSIYEFYANCPEGYQVDHIVPLQGKTVCGLHVLHNLQYLTVYDNLSKNNKF